MSGSPGEQNEGLYKTTVSQEMALYYGGLFYY